MGLEKETEVYRKRDTLTETRFKGKNIPVVSTA